MNFIFVVLFLIIKIEIFEKSFRSHEKKLLRSVNKGLFNEFEIFEAK
jgi:hypothetical protein